MGHILISALAAFAFGSLIIYFVNVGSLSTMPYLRRILCAHDWVEVSKFHFMSEVEHIQSLGLVPKSFQSCKRVQFITYKCNRCKCGKVKKFHSVS